MNSIVLRIVAVAVLAGAGGMAFAYKPLFEIEENLALRGNSLTWHVWVPGESADGDRWDPLFHDVVSYWNAQLPFFNLSAVTQESEACSPRSLSGYLTAQNQVSTASWRETTCGGGPAEEFAGWAHTFLDNPGGQYEIVEGDVFFNELFLDSGHPENMVFDDLSFYAVALHEIGHNLGLGHGIFDNTTMAYGPTPTWNRRLSPDDICGVAVVSGNREHCPIGLGQAVATNNAETLAHFSGYASADTGLTARETLRPWQEFNVYATVLIDPAHRNKQGQLHVVAETGEGQLFARDADGEWHLYTGGDLPAATAPGNLEHAEELVILGRNGITRGLAVFDSRHGYALYREALTGIRLGLEGVSLKFWVAYSSETEPGVLIYGSEPIRVAWTLE